MSEIETKENDDPRLTDYEGNEYDYEKLDTIKKKRRTCYQKCCGNVDEGSLRGAIFSLSSLTIGTGCFALPNRCVQLGLLNQILLLLFGAYCAYWSLTGMIHASRNSKNKDFSRLVKESLGKIPGILLDVIILVYIFGVLISYQVVIYSLVGRVYFELFENPSKITFDSFEKTVWETPTIKYPVMFGTSILLIPLCLLKDLSKMSFTSTIGICALLYTIFVIVFQSPFFYKYYKDNYFDEKNPHTHPNIYNATPSLRPDLNIFQCFATVFFCFTCHIGAFPVYNSLKNNTTKRIHKVFRRSLGLDFIIYFLVSVCGYLTAPLTQPSLIIYRENNGVIENDIFMTIAKLGITVCLSMAIPPNYNSFRISFLELFLGSNEITDKSNYLLTIPTILITTFIAAVYNDILKFISLLGGFCGVIIAFLMPGLIYIKNNDYNLTNVRNIFSLLFICSLCTIGFIAGIESLLF